jgi:hypothetical protein
MIEAQGAGDRALPLKEDRQNKGLRQGAGAQVHGHRSAESLGRRDVCITPFLPFTFSGFCLFPAVLGMEPRAFHMLGKFIAAKLHPQTPFSDVLISWPCPFWSNS